MNNNYKSKSDSIEQSKSQKPEEIIGQSPTADQLDQQKRHVIAYHKRNKIADYEPEARKCGLGFD